MAERGEPRAEHRGGLTWAFGTSVSHEYLQLLPGRVVGVPGMTGRIEFHSLSPDKATVGTGWPCAPGSSAAGFRAFQKNRPEAILRKASCAFWVEDEFREDPRGHQAVLSPG